MEKCKCGFMLRETQCERCGRVYDLLKVEENEVKTEESIKGYIIEKSSVLQHSSWGDYYDFPTAPQEVINAYIKDMNKHKECVKGYLEVFSDKELIGVRDKIEEEVKGETYLADRVLKEIGYKYTELN